jgi:putative peptide zinc metalloprotease protein
MRPDLAVERSVDADAGVVLKDPWTLRYYRLSAEDFAVLELLDGKRSLEAVKRALETRFAPRKFRLEEISQFATSLHQAGLLEGGSWGQGTSLLNRRRKMNRAAWVQRLTNPLAMRFRGIDPGFLFTRLLVWLRPLFSPAACALMGLSILAAASLVLVKYDEFSRRLPSFHQFFTPSNLLVLTATLGAIKVFHEFGHGLACRKFGGEVHELGIMLLVFAPCLYCDVTDAWRMPARRRIIISAAGIFVELFIASLATFVWWNTQPGLVNQICLGIMFLSSVSTILINGNPLMRYDGYYILSDFLKVPNLAQRSNAVVRDLITRFCLGVVEEPDPLLPTRRRGWYAAYSIASVVYRMVLTFSIVVFMVELLRPYRLEAIARVMALCAVGSLIGVPLFQAVRYLFAPGRLERLNKHRTLISCSAAAATVLAIALVPVPHRVWGTLELEPFDAERVYVDTTGMLTEVYVKPGDKVAANDRIARLVNDELDLRIADLTSRAATQRVELDSVHRERFHSPHAALRIPELEKSLRALDEQIAQRRRERERLTLVAPKEGTVMPALIVPPPPEGPAGELPSWSGFPTDPRNRCCTLEEGTLFCRIAGSEAWSAVIAVDQSDVELLEIGQAVDVRLDGLPAVTLGGRIDEISRNEMSAAPRRLSSKAGGEVATKPIPPASSVR